MIKTLLWITCLSLAALLAPAQAQTDPSPALYVLGPDDQITIRALNMEEEIGKEPYRVDFRGNIDVPLIGRVQAGGLTVEQLETELSHRLAKELTEPTVSISIKEFRSQPVSVLGAVLTPGVHQIHGSKTLFEVLSAAGGLKPEAGNTIHITRRKKEGPIPLPGARPDPTGEFYTAEVKVKSVMEATNPEENILIKPDDVISVPKGDLVYVTGSVKRPGGFVLNEKDSISILAAITLAEGLDTGAGAAKCRILRLAADGTTRTEIPIDLKKMLDGKSQDGKLIANDILFVPTNAAQNAVLRGLETGIITAASLAVYRIP
jgi:polysaccharide export outer membrane protein